MYSNSKFVAKNGKFISPVTKVHKGVKQGDRLSPMLFNIYTNDVPEVFDQLHSDPVSLDSTKLNCLLYADDLILISESEKGLQSCLDSLSQHIVLDYLPLNGGTHVFFERVIFLLLFHPEVHKMV